MVEYRALAQNSIKITTETTLNHNADFGSPVVPNYPRIKILSADGTSIKYVNVIPSKKLSSTSQGFAVATNAAADTYKVVTEDNCKPCEGTFVNVEGNRYWGQKSANYAFDVTTGQYSSSGTSGIPTLGTCLGGKMKTAIYSNAGGTIVLTEEDISALLIDKFNGSTSSSKYLTRIAYLAIRKETNDVVLAIEIEYPKFDVTVHNSADGVQYSLDDGATFQDMPASLDLSQIEHVIVKNTGTAEISIGTNDGGAQIATVAAGAKRVFVPEADTVCYIS